MSYVAWKRTWVVWNGMKARVTDPGHRSYADYQELGVIIAPEWLHFGNFLRDMGNAPKGLSLERKDNTKGYCKDNCCWATPLEQARNKRIYRTNKTGISGIFWDKGLLQWKVKCYGKYLGIRKDFFEACCLRKSFEYYNKENAYVV